VSRAHVARIEDLPSVPGTGDDAVDWKPIQHHLCLAAFGANAFIARAAGAELIGRHDETGADGQEELYVVLAGEARFTLDGEEVDVAAGAVVAVPDRATVRRAVATRAGTAILAVGAPPGRPFERSTWRAEWFRDVPRLGA
jgi:hypothetical protein